jgi:UDP-MurNAc hydroxylase
MRITGLGHASMLIETAHGTVLTDPWVNPAYFGAWFPFPDNSGLDWERIGDVDYLFVSHLHRDHFDPDHLRRYVSKRATVLLPAYEASHLREALEDCGFTRFVETVSEEVTEVDGLQVMIQALITPADGPIGDSSLWLDDGEHRILNQNDARPADLGRFRELGPVDAHLLQFSGAVWYPMVYELPERAKQALGRAKRARQFDRTLRYIEDLGARYVFPTAGPPCFLDHDLWHLNDIFGDDSNTFPDQPVFLSWLAERGHPEGRLLLPGSTADLAAEGSPVSHAVDPESIFASRETKARYLEAMRGRRLPQVDAERPLWAHPEIDIVASLAAWFNPLLEQADRIAEGIGGCLHFTAEDADRGDVDFVIDFAAREVRVFGGERARYRFRTQRSYLEQVIHAHEVDWVNSLFLSCRFSAYRVGPYNENIYVFFKCLSDERLNYAEAWLAESDAAAAAEEIQLDGWQVQRRCAHMKADLSRFGRVDGDILTCQMHGWQWDLRNGRCLTSAGHEVRSRPVAAEPVGARRGDAESAEGC